MARPMKTKTPTLNAKPRSSCCAIAFYSFKRQSCSVNPALQIHRVIGTAEEKILEQRIAGRLQFLRRAVKINPALVQVGDVMADVERALHVVRDHDTRHA